MLVGHMVRMDRGEVYIGCYGAYGTYGQRKGVHRLLVGLMVRTGRGEVYIGC